MIRSIVVSAKAADEIRNAVKWYNEELWGLGDEFLIKLDFHYDLISRYPERYKQVNKSTQRCLMERFPYIIFFTLDKDDLIILRIRHSKQKPLKRFR